MQCNWNVKCKCRFQCNVLGFISKMNNINQKKTYNLIKLESNSNNKNFFNENIQYIKTCLVFATAICNFITLFYTKSATNQLSNTL